MLGIDGLFLAKLSETVINESKDGYPELEEKKEFIFKVLTQEEEKFNKTIDQGLAILSDLMEEMKKRAFPIMRTSLRPVWKNRGRKLEVPVK